MTMIHTYRNTTTGETAPAHRLGTDAQGRTLYRRVEGWEPTSPYLDTSDGWVAGEDPVHCKCGRITGVRCEWSGPKSETVEVEWMPEYLRASHGAGGNSGSWPHNGAEHLTLQASCAESLADEWTTVIEGTTEG